MRPTTTDEPRSPDAEPSQATAAADGAAAASSSHAAPRLSRQTPNVEIVDGARACAGSTSSARRRSTAPGSRSTSTSTRSTTRTSSRATSARRSTSTTTTCSSSCTSRSSTRRVGRLNAAELDIFVGPDFVITLPNEPLQPVEYLFERCRAQARSCASSSSRKGSGYLLYKIVDDCVDASFPMLRKMGNKLERLEEDIFEGQRSQEIVRDISNVKQEIINFRKIVRPQRAALRDLEAQAALHRPRTSRSTSTTSTTPPSASGTCSRTTRRSSRRSRRPTSR